MIEICKTLELLKNINAECNSFHLAEGPGGFIEALSYMRNNPNDKYVVSNNFHQFDINLNYTQELNQIGLELKYLVGLKNITNSYQSDFDILKNRDSNYVYGLRLSLY